MLIFLNWPKLMNAPKLSFIKSCKSLGPQIISLTFLPLSLVCTRFVFVAKVTNKREYLKSFSMPHQILLIFFLAHPIKFVIFLVLP